MALQSSGAISLSDIQTEFGGSNPISLSEYIRNGAYVPDAAANASIPTTTSNISFSQFYGATNQVSFTISSNQQELNLQTYLTGQGWDGSTPVFLTINSGVYLWSNSTSTAGLIIPSAFNNILTIINNGYIIGKGGQGGSGPSNSGLTAGGPALSNSAVGVTLINNAGAYIAGGGGGGGSGRDAYANTHYGGGGGGAGGGRGGDGYAGSGSNLAPAGSGGAGGAIGQAGYNGTGGFWGAGGNHGGGGGGWEVKYTDGSWSSMAGGGGGGRIVTGTQTPDSTYYSASGAARGTGSGAGWYYAGPTYGHGGAHGGIQNGNGNSSSMTAGGGGGWGAAGGTGRGGYAGGAGGAAITGTAIASMTNNGTIWGSQA